MRVSLNALELMEQGYLKIADFEDLFTTHTRGVVEEAIRVRDKKQKDIDRAEKGREEKARPDVSPGRVPFLIATMRMSGTPSTAPGSVVLG